jgi:hypothetical protein
MPELKRITWTDEKGYDRAALLPAYLPDSQAEYGIPSEPPNTDALDWDAIKRDLHNQLLDAGLLTWIDVQKNQDKVTTICRRVLAKPVLNLYRIMEVNQ